MSRIPDGMLEIMLRHTEIKRAAACEMIRNDVDAGFDSPDTLGHLELSFWSKLNELLLELRAYRASVKVKP